MRFPIQRKSTTQIEKIQFKKLKKLLNHAYAHSKFYKQHYDINNFHPDDFKSMADVHKIPVVNRNQLKQAATEDVITRPHSKKLHRHTTSGSSGIPVPILYTEWEKYKTLYTVLRAYLMGGMKLTDLTVGLRDPIDIKKQTFYQKLGLIPYEYHNIYDSISGIFDKIVKKHKQVDILKAYPTDLANLAFLNKSRNDFPPVRMIYSDSEVLDDATRKFVEQELKTPIIDFYASVECGMIAFQTIYGPEYSVNEDFVLLEQRPVKGFKATEGEAILTNLFNFTTPIIRYEIGDVIDFGDNSRPENSPIGLKTIKKVHGKYLDFIILPDDTIISPHVPKQDMTHIGNIKAFQLQQNKRYHILIKIQKDVGYTDETETKLLKMMNKAFKNLVTIELEYHDELTRGDVRKFKVIESKVAQEFLSELQKK